MKEEKIDKSIFLLFHYKNMLKLYNKIFDAEWFLSFHWRQNKSREQCFEQARQDYWIFIREDIAKKYINKLILEKKYKNIKSMKLKK